MSAGTTRPSPRTTWRRLASLGTLGSVLPALEKLVLSDHWGAADPDGVQRLAEGLGAGALPAVTRLQIFGMHVGDAGASALAAALGRGALPRLKWLSLGNATIGDSGLVALAPALRRLPALETDDLKCNPLGDEGLAALVAPPPPAGAPPPTTGVLAKLKVLWLGGTQVADAGCATLAAALDGGARQALNGLHPHEDLYLGHVACGVLLGERQREFERSHGHRQPSRGAPEPVRTVEAYDVRDGHRHANAAKVPAAAQHSHALASAQPGTLPCIADACSPQGADALDCVDPPRDYRGPPCLRCGPPCDRRWPESQHLTPC
jgi:hypothetical protein